MIRLLFLSRDDAARGPMAEALARRLAGPDIEVRSAGVTPAAESHPLAVETLREAGFDLSSRRPQALAGLPLAGFDVVVTLCASAAAHCDLLFPGEPAQVDWGIEDPRTAGAQGPEAFRACRDELRRLVADLFQRGYLRALAWAKNQSSRILENLSEGVIAHDLDRRILYFNGAAERITGYPRAEILGQDCHTVFPPAFCGPECSFCSGAPDGIDPKNYSVSVACKGGERRELEMAVRPIRDDGGALRGVLASFRDRTREQALARRLGEVESFQGILGRDKKMLELFDLVRSVADSAAPVLITGESGTGKELVAAAIHREGPRAHGRFVAVNCGALPDGLLESELFGHVKGAFTGAIRDKAGRFELADGGTIFLDEIGDISPAMQVKLLRVLQEGAFERVGESSTRRVDVRVISATHRDLRREIEAGRFREDLFYRLCVVPLPLPPLRERLGDLPFLARHLLERAAAAAGREAPDLGDSAIAALLAHRWPGNVRELQNALQYALVTRRGPRIEASDLPPSVAGATPSGAGARRPPERSGKRGRRPKLSAETVREALAACGGSKVEAARRLGVGRATLYRTLER